MIFKKNKNEKKTARKFIPLSILKEMHYICPRCRELNVFLGSTGETKKDTCYKCNNEKEFTF